MASSSRRRSKFENQPSIVDLDNMMDHLEEEFVDTEENLVEEISTNINSQEQVQLSQTRGGGSGRGGSDIFQMHFKKTQQRSGLYEVSCNYYPKKYTYQVGGGYGSF